MLRLKAGVDCAHIQPELLLGLIIAEGAFRSYEQDCTVTSLYDGKHGANTLHQRDGKCRAADLRSKMLPPEIIPNLLTEMRTALGANFDLILEAANTANEHFHLEYDPKENTGMHL